MRTVVKADRCPLFDAPGGAVLSDELLTGWDVEILSQKDGWAHLRTDYRYEGWAPLAALEPGPGPAGEKRAVVASFADVMAAPAVQSALRFTLYRGAAITPDGSPIDGYQPVRLPGGEAGFARADALGPAPILDVSDPDDFRARVCRAALGYRGVPYRWGGKTPMGIDCSGLVFMAYRLNGALIYRDARLREDFSVLPISPHRLRPADLLYYPGHVALYLGEGRYVHSTAKEGSGGVVINSLTPGDPLFREDLSLERLTAAGRFAPLGME